MRIHQRFRKTNALTFLEVIAIIAVMVVLIGLLLPALNKPSRGGSRMSCVNHLKQLGLAARIFATDNAEKFPWQVSTNKSGSQEFRDLPNSAFQHFLVMSNELSTPKMLVCPEDKERTIALHWQIGNQNVSYFVGLDAQEESPDSLLAGDRNLMTNGVPVGGGLLELTTNLTVGWTAQLHNNAGNVLFGDGHVDQFSSARLRECLKSAERPHQRVAIP